MGKKTAVTIVVDSDVEVTVKPLAAQFATQAAVPGGAQTEGLTGTATVTSSPGAGADGDGDVDTDF